MRIEEAQEAVPYGLLIRNPNSAFRNLQSRSQDGLREQEQTTQYV